MSQRQDDFDMERPSTAGGSVKRARERAEAGLPRDPSSVPPPMVNNGTGMDMGLGAVPRRPVGVATAGQSRLPRPQAPPGLQTKDGQISVAISRPIQAPQWPLQGPIITSQDAEPYKPPPGRSQQPPQRPPRPSRVPSMLDASRVQDHTPVFQYTPQSNTDSQIDMASSVPPTPSSRQSTTSSVGTIPDFPIPVAMPQVPPPRRSVNLGPPPSSRRGASSFYSNASFVSPIPEESPRTRSHTSFASSAAMPESWGTDSPGPSPQYPDAYYEDAITEDGRESMYEDDNDNSRLVRSASIGKRAKPSLVVTKPSLPVPTMPITPEPMARPSPSPVQPTPFSDGTGYVDASSSSGTLPMAKRSSTANLTPEAMLGAYNSASATDSSSARDATPSPRPYSRLSAIRRPPKLDTENVGSRGSMTSLPDLIRRATRLAAMIDRGRRPASRFDDFDFPDEKAAVRDSDRELSSKWSHMKPLTVRKSGFFIFIF
jgi:hypothetical protein